MNNNFSLVLLLCLSPLAIIFIVTKLALLGTEAVKFKDETERLKRMQKGPYEIWDYEDEDEW